MITVGRQRIEAFPWSWQDGYSGRIYIPAEHGDKWAWMIDQYREHLRGNLFLESGEADSLRECVGAIEEWLGTNAGPEQMLLDL
jgi:hypothetical protein